MIVEQQFLESDLTEIERVFSKSMENKSPILARGIRICNFLARECIFILLGCSVAIIVLMGRISREVILCVVVDVIAALTVIGHNRLKVKMKPINVVKRKYGRPFRVVMNKDAFSYKQINYFYTDVKLVIDYKSFLFIKINRRILVMKLNVDEKKELFSRITGTRVIYADEPFDFRELR